MNGMMKNPFKRFTQAPVLGGRELAVLQVLWVEGEVSAQEVLENMPGSKISLSTVQSTLERLYRKQLLKRSKIGRAYCYKARYSQSEIIGQLMTDIAWQVGGGETAAMISGFADYLAAESQDEKLRDLREQLRAVDAKQDVKPDVKKEP